MNMVIAIVCGFASGVALRSFFILDWKPILFVTLVAALVALAAYIRPTRFAAGSAMFLFFFSLGVMRMSIAETALPNSFTPDIGKRVSFEGRVVADPDVRDSTQRVAILVSNDTEETVMLAIAPRHPAVQVGDTVRVSGTLAIPEPFATENGRTFRYDQYLERDGIRFLLNFASLSILEEAPWYSVPAAFAKAKHSFLDGLATALSEPYASLAGGIVIGGKSGLGTELKDAFVRSGLVPIIVLSGYNIMVVAEWLMAMLALTPLPKRWGAVAGCAAIFIFVGIAGGGAAAFRAALMALIALYARATGRTYAAGRALLVAVLAMLIYNPLFLLYDPGFGLSVAATAGLIWLAPIFETLLGFIKNAFWKNAVATTLAAQTTVLPLLLYETGLLSFVSVPANLIVLPFVPLAMGLSAIAGFAGMAFGSVAPILATLAGLPAYLSNALIIFVAETSSALPLAAISIPSFPFVFVLAAYAILIYFASSKRFSITDQFTFAKKAST